MTGGIARKFRYHNLGEMATMGRFAATVSSPLFGLAATGPLAAALRRATYLARMPSDNHAAQVAGQLQRDASFTSCWHALLAADVLAYFRRELDTATTVRPVRARFANAQFVLSPSSKEIA